MGSSLILQGGAAVVKTLKESVTQTGHGFTVGDVIRWDGAQVPPKYVKAIADTAQNAEVAGVVSSTPDPNEFEVTYHGYIDLPSLSGSSAPVMFLSGSVGGSLAASPPSAVGTVVKPVLTKNSNGSGYLVMNYLGTQIGGSSTIAVDEIQPVGTIMPYAGTAIPDTWLACDGGSYAMSAYPELYEKICFTTGERAPMYGHIVEICPNSQVISSTEWTASAVGDYIYIKNRTTTASASVPDVNTEASFDFVGRIIAKGSVTHTTADGWTVRILGKYNTTSKRFEMPNEFVLSVSGGFSSSIRVYSGVATGARGIGGAVNTASAVAFNTPNLRGRFLFGEVGSGEFIPDADPETLSTFAYDYPMASWGGEERHAITTAEIPAHNHTASTSSSGDHKHFQFANVNDPTPVSTVVLTATQQVAATQSGGGSDLAYGLKTTDVAATLGLGSASGTHTHTVTVANTGSNTPHNNMPPYLAVRYIIKAKPYTRAAIIDGIDLPYNSLLVRDLRSRNVGGSNGDLVFHTNTSGDSGNGTERMRLTTGGRLAVSNTNPLARLSVGSGSYSAINDYCADFISDNTDAGFGGVLFSQNSTNGFKLWTIGTGNSTPSNNLLNLDLIVKSTGLTLDSRTEPIMSIRGNGWVGIGTSPQSTLDVNGTLKVSGQITHGTAPMSVPSGSAPLFAVRAWGRITPNGASNPSLVVGGNVASVTRQSVSVLRVTLTTPMPNANYSVVASCVGQTITGVSQRTTVATEVINSSSFDLIHASGGNTANLVDFVAANIISFMVIG